MFIEIWLNLLSVYKNNKKCHFWSKSCLLVLTGIGIACGLNPLHLVSPLCAQTAASALAKQINETFIPKVHHYLINTLKHTRPKQHGTLNYFKNAGIFEAIHSFQCSIFSLNAFVWSRLIYGKTTRDGGGHMEWCLFNTDIPFQTLLSNNYNIKPV